MNLNLKKSICGGGLGNTYRTYVDPIVKLQKTVIRIINKTLYHDTTNKLFIELHIKIHCMLTLYV